MELGDKEISEMVDSGRYFDEAWGWYASKYLFPITERIYLFLFSFVIVWGFLIIYSNVQDLLPLVRKVPFTIMVEDSDYQFSYFTPLIQDDETPQEAVSRYLVNKYVEVREEYNPVTRDNELKFIKRRVKHSSTKDVYVEFERYVRQTNPRGPYLRFRKHTKRIVNIVDFRFLDNERTSGKVEVVFEESLFSLTERKVKEKNRYVVAVHFRLPDVEAIGLKEGSLRFIVSHYKAKFVGRVKL